MKKFKLPFHQSKTSPRQSCYKFCLLLLDSALTHPPIRAPTKCLLAQSFPPQVFLTRTLSLYSSQHPQTFPKLFFSTGASLYWLTYFSSDLIFALLSTLHLRTTTTINSSCSSTLQDCNRIRANRELHNENLNHSFDRFLLVSLHLLLLLHQHPHLLKLYTLVRLQPQHPSTHNKERNFFHIRLAWLSSSSSSVGSNKYRDVLPDYYDRRHSVLNILG